MNLQFFKETSLPGTLQPNAFYFVTSTGPGGGLFAESYLTDSSGAARMIGNTAMISEIANNLSMAELFLAADIAARDALALSANALVLVTDASADATVTSGAAMYFWDNTGGSFIKVTEFESLDVVLDWNNLVNGPSSTAAQIDQAVTDSHTHANKAVLDAITSAGSGAIITGAERTAITHANRTELDKIGEDGNGCLTYDGTSYGSWSTLAW